MPTIFSKQRDNKEYYKQQSDNLNRQADKVQNETGNQTEAARLRSLAKEADQQAQSIDQQLNNVAEDLNK